MRNLLVAVGVLFAVQLAARSASADYVCSTNYHPSTTSTSGSEGYVTLSAYSAPDCGGTLVNTYYFCTTGATATTCAASSSFRYERLGVLAVYRALLDALVNNTRIALNTTGCNGGGSTSCATRVLFWAD